MQFEGFYSLNDSVVGSFPHWHHQGFQLLQFLSTGSNIFEAKGRGKNMHNVASPTPMCVLYDQGYQKPDVQMSYVYAMEVRVKLCGLNRDVGESIKYKTRLRKTC